MNYTYKRYYRHITMLSNVFLWNWRKFSVWHKMLYHHIVVIKEWCEAARDHLCRTTLSWCHIIGIRGKHINVSVNNARDTTVWCSFIQIMYSRLYCHYQGHSFNISGKCTVYISPKETLTDNYIVTLKGIELYFITGNTNCDVMHTM